MPGWGLVLFCVTAGVASTAVMLVVLAIAGAPAESLLPLLLAALVSPTVFAVLVRKNRIKAASSVPSNPAVL